MERTGTNSRLNDRELAAWKGMLATHAELVHRLDAELERDHGLPLSAYEVLMNLSDADGGELRMSELANRLLLSRSGITRLVDRLEQQGYVERRRCDDDGRGFYAVLTPAGRRKLHACRGFHLDGVRRHFLAALEPAELDALARVWDRLRGENGAAELAKAH